LPVMSDLDRAAVENALEAVYRNITTVADGLGEAELMLPSLCAGSALITPTRTRLSRAVGATGPALNIYRDDAGITAGELFLISSELIFVVAFGVALRRKKPKSSSAVPPAKIIATAESSRL
jgi:hypothetical protein